MGKRDADFCYAFASQAILNWKLAQEIPLYEINISEYPVYKAKRSINGITFQELYPDKTCIYIFGKKIGELLLIGGETKDELQKIDIGAVCRFGRKNIDKKRMHLVIRTRTVALCRSVHALIDIGQQQRLNLLKRSHNGSVDDCLKHGRTSPREPAPKTNYP